MLILRDWFLLVLSMVDQPAQLGVFINDKPTLLYLYRSKDRNWKDMTAQKACLKQNVFHLPGGIFIWCDLDTPFLGLCFSQPQSMNISGISLDGITMKSQNMGSHRILVGILFLSLWDLPMDIQFPKTNSLPLKMDAWETILFLWRFGLFSCFFCSWGYVSKYPSFPSWFSGKLRGVVPETMTPWSHRAPGPLKPDPWDFTDRFSIQHLGKLWGLIFHVPSKKGRNVG